MKNLISRGGKTNRFLNRYLQYFCFDIVAIIESTAISNLYLNCITSSVPASAAVGWHEYYEWQSVSGGAVHLYQSVVWIVWRDTHVLSTDVSTDVVVAAVV